MVHILAIYGSPRRKGNTSLLLQEAVKGAREAGTQIEEVVVRDLGVVVDYDDLMLLYSAQDLGYGRS